LTSGKLVVTVYAFAISRADRLLAMRREALGRTVG
jgi:hypothetical protein